ncbi:insulin-like growth factor-binding protein complex acid labile subunit [Photinus pyralis]|nr:insulin-like growth factor-binding protein complex acid labile subunit [Photinus pyralis]
MFKTWVILFLIKLSVQCQVPSFDYNMMEVNGESQEINGCISPDKILYKGEISNIKVKHQNIQNLNYGAVQKISSRFFIDFVNTSIAIIREGAFLDLPQLHLINFEGNDLSWISENAFKDLPSLTEIYLDHNKIQDISPRAFNNLPELAKASLRGNTLASFDQSWFYKTPDLQFLNLGQNRLRNIQRGAFIKLPSLTRLWLDKNQIQFVDKDALKGLKNLKYLSLTENKLKNFDFNFYAPSKSISVSTNHNNITYISDEMLNVIGSKFLYLLITGNPLQCACLDKLIQLSDTFNIHVPQLKFTQSGAVCTIPKTKPNQCLERRDDDFQEGFWISFKREHTSTETLD